MKIDYIYYLIMAIGLDLSSPTLVSKVASTKFTAADRHVLSDIDIDLTRFFRLATLTLPFSDSTTPVFSISAPPTFPETDTF